MRTFLGKSQHEAEEMFASNALNFGEDIQHMPPAVFSFYAQALINYLLSDRARDDSDGASSFLNRILFMLKWSPGTLAGIREAVMQAAVVVASRQEFYGADESIYGSFAELLDAIKAAS